MKRFFCFFFIIVIVLSFLSSCDIKSDEKTPYSYDLSPYITLGMYKGFEVEKGEVEISDEDFKIALDEIRYAYSESKPINGRGITKDDIVSIEYYAKIDGTLLYDVLSYDYEVDFSDPKLPTEVIDSIIGKNTGDEFTVETVFDDEYELEKYRGKEVVFEIKILSAYELILPEINSEFVKTYFSFDTVEEFENDFRKRLNNAFLEEAIYNQKVYLWEAAVENATFISLPQEEITRNMNIFSEPYKEDAKNYDYEWIFYLDINHGLTTYEFDKMAYEYAEKKVKEELVVFSIAKNENIIVSEQEYNDKVKEFATEDSVTVEELEAEHGRFELELSILWDKVINFLLENAIVK